MRQQHQTEAFTQNRLHADVKGEYMPIISSEHILILTGTLMFTGFGIALIRTAFRMKSQAREKADACTACRSGRIIRNERTVTDRVGNDGRRKMTTYHPVVRFTDSTGKVHEYTHRVGTNPPSYREGQVVPVKYDPKHPRQFILPKDDDSSPFMRKFLILFGIMCLFTAVSFMAIGLLAV